MNTLSLSVSSPSSGKGSSLRNSPSTSVSSRCSRTSSGAHSVQPVAISVSTKVCTSITRPQYLRKGLRYASDVTEAEWRMIEPRLPAPRRLGRPRKTALLAVVNALFYIARTGCQWRMLPGDFPHYSTVQRYFYAWRDDGTCHRINCELLLQAR